MTGSSSRPVRAATFLATATAAALALSLPLPSCDDDGTCADGTLCGRVCVMNFATDELACGGCGNSCAPGETCWDGECRCDPPRFYCDDVCTDVESDNYNCGGCGTRCLGYSRCEAGVCICWEVCPEIDEWGRTVLERCTYTELDPFNCGECGNTCEPSEVCYSGFCVDAGESPDCEPDCDGEHGFVCCADDDGVPSCVTLGTDENCGECGHECHRSPCNGRECDDGGG